MTEPDMIIDPQHPLGQAPASTQIVGNPLAQMSMPVTAATPMEMLSRALQMGATPETLEKLLALQERWEAGIARKAYDKAIAAAKGEIPPIIKNRTVSHGTGRATYRHEDLAQIARAIDPVLGKHGLSYRWRTLVDGDRISVTCIISHQDGHAEENTLSAPADASGAKNTLQAIGSALTYLQRYSLKAALGLAASDDDDAVAATPNGRLSATQIEELQLAIVGAGVNIERFCAVYGIDRVEELPVRLLNQAIHRLNAVRQRQEANRSPPEQNQ
jgi:hypothetical protein